MSNHQWNNRKRTRRRKAGKFTQQSERTWCLKERSRWARPSVAGQRSGNMEKSDISVKGKLMTRWNVPSNPGLSACLSHGLKISRGHWQRRSPSAVYNRDRSPPFMNYSTYSILRMHPESNKRISPWVCSGPGGGTRRLLYLVTSTQTDTEHLNRQQVHLKAPQDCYKK